SGGAGAGGLRRGAFQFASHLYSDCARRRRAGPGPQVKHVLVAMAGLAAACHAATGSPLNVPFFHQQTNGCGAASVAMVMHYWERQQPPERVYQRLYNADQKGILLSDMKRYLEESGFRAFTLRGEWNDIEQHLAKGRPIIVSLKKNRAARIHFAVVI